MQESKEELKNLIKNLEYGIQEAEHLIYLYKEQIRDWNEQGAEKNI